MGLTNLHAKLIAVLLLVTLGACAQTTVIPDKLRIKTVPQSPVSGDMMVTVDASGNIKKDTIKSGSTTTHSLSFTYGFLGQPFSFNGSTPIVSMVDTTKLQTILNFFPKGDTRYAKIGGGTLTNTLTFGTGLVSGSFNNSANVTEKVDTTVVQTILNFFPKGDTRYYKSSNPSNYISRTGISATAPITYNNSTGVIGITQATTSTDGYLSSTDWNTFNNKSPKLFYYASDFVVPQYPTDGTTQIQNAINTALSGYTVINQKPRIWFAKGYYQARGLVNASQVDFVGEDAYFINGDTYSINQLTDKSQFTKSPDRALTYQFNPTIRHPLLYVGDSITEGTAATDLGTLTGGGTVKCPVFYDGTAWKSY